jgi:glycosyltransferase involved in cell wall biosynthesis
VVNVDWFFVSHRLPISIEAINQGYEVHIATTITDKLDFFEGLGLIVHPLNLSRSSKGLFSVFSEFREIYAVMRDVNPELAHLISIKPVLLGGIAARLNRIPALVSAVSGLGFVFIRKGIISNFFQYLISIMYRLCFSHKNQCVIFQNLDDLQKLTKLTKISEDKTVLIHGSGVDLSRFNYSFPSKSDTPIVMLASRLLVDKGVREFIRAAKLVKESCKSVRFILVGDPDYEYPLSIQHEEIEKWKKDNIVEIWGYRDDMNIVLSMANIVVLPSYREGFSKVLSEASAIGRAIITTNVPGCRDVIKDGVTGLLVPERNVEILASKISYLIDNPSLCREMGRAGRERAEKLFDVNQVISQHMVMYEKLLNN